MSKCKGKVSRFLQFGPKVLYIGGERATSRPLHGGPKSPCLSALYSSSIDYYYLLLTTATWTDGKRSSAQCSV
jgi:hypothetical protein